MRINRFVALALGISRRAADKLADEGEILVNGRAARTGYDVSEHDVVTYHDKVLAAAPTQTILFNKPAGYVVSREGQGSKTIYELLPTELLHLKPVGRLDKDSSGLLLLTNDGQLADRLTHPRYEKEKVYEVKLKKSLYDEDKQEIEQGVQLDDGLSKLHLEGSGSTWRITMHEGRNRQIRRTFSALGYEVIELHRTNFGDYKLDELRPGKFRKV
jgi:23S rRNA pseudouridine2605 synthase